MSPRRRVRSRPRRKNNDNDQLRHHSPLRPAPAFAQHQHDHAHHRVPRLSEALARHDAAMLQEAVHGLQICFHKNFPVNSVWSSREEVVAKIRAMAGGCRFPIKAGSARQTLFFCCRHQRTRDTAPACDKKAHFEYDTFLQRRYPWAAFGTECSFRIHIVGQPQTKEVQIVAANYRHSCVSIQNDAENGSKREALTQRCARLLSEQPDEEEDVESTTASAVLHSATRLEHENVPNPLHIGAHVEARNNYATTVAQTSTPSEFAPPLGTINLLADTPTRDIEIFRADQDRIHPVGPTSVDVATPAMPTQDMEHFWFEGKSTDQDGTKRAIPDKTLNASMQDVPEVRRRSSNAGFVVPVRTTGKIGGSALESSPAVAEPILWPIPAADCLPIMLGRHQVRRFLGLSDADCLRISRQQILLDATPDDSGQHYSILNLGKNAIVVNGRELQRNVFHALVHGDTVHIGESLQLHFTVLQPESTVGPLTSLLDGDESLLRNGNKRSLALVSPEPVRKRRCLSHADVSLDRFIL